MSARARRAYRRFATFFLAIGSVFLMLGVARATFLPDVLRGDPLPVALLLLAIGGGLRWTVRVRPGEEDESDGMDALERHEDADDDGDDDEAEEGRGRGGGPRVS